MKNYYCRVEVGDKRIWGFRKAMTSDLALACFMQDEGIQEKDQFAFADTVDMILVDRLMEFIDGEVDPWGCETPFSLRDLEDVSDPDVEEQGIETSYDQKMREDGRIRDRRWHAARIRWLIKNPKMLEDPISLDNHCHYGRVFPLPEICDGWHRLFAHRFLGRTHICALYSGRTDLLNYLTGKRKTPPKD